MASSHKGSRFFDKALIVVGGDGGPVNNFFDTLPRKKSMRGRFPSIFHRLVKRVKSFLLFY